MIARELLAMGHSVVGLVLSKEKAEAFASASGTALLGEIESLDVVNFLSWRYRDPERQLYADSRH